MGETVYYCGFNGFRQVPSLQSPTLTSLVPHPVSSKQVSLKETGF